MEDHLLLTTDHDSRELENPSDHILNPFNQNMHLNTSHEGDRHNYASGPPGPSGRASRYDWPPLLHLVIILTVLLFVFLILYFVFGMPFVNPIYKADPDIAYPHQTTAIVPFALVLIPAIFAPPLVILFTCWRNNVPFYTTLQGSAVGQDYSFWSVKGLSLLLEPCFCYWIALLVNAIVTRFLKLSVGRPRYQST